MSIYCWIDRPTRSKCQQTSCWVMTAVWMLWVCDFCLRSWWSFARRKAGWNILSYVSGINLLKFAFFKLENRMNMDENETLSESPEKIVHLFNPPSINFEHLPKICTPQALSEILMGHLQAWTLQAASPRWWIVSWILRCVVPQRSPWRRPKLWPDNYDILWPIMPSGARRNFESPNPALKF